MHIPGLSVGIVKDGKMIREKGYGFANLELSVPASTSTVYQIASVTKIFTATAIMILVQEGRLSLDDKISTRLPDLPEAWTHVTVRQLLTHTSGIADYTELPRSKSETLDLTHREVIDVLANRPLEFAPGTKWKYDNTGYFLLGMLIEQITGKAYGDFLNERVFQPLGMANTRVTDLHAITPNRAQAYVLDGKNLRIGPFVSPTWPFSAGSLSSTVSDLLKWDQALVAGKLLDKPTQDLMWRPTEQSLAAGSGYGYGWNVQTLYGHRVISHGGMIPGFYAEFCRFVDDRLTIVLLMNATGGLINPRKLRTRIAEQLLPELVPKPPEPAADPDPELTKRLAEVVARAMRGEMVAEAFETKLQPELASLFRRAADFDSLFGRLQTLQLLERKVVDAGLQLRYRAIFENDTARVYLDLDKDGKISRWGLGSDD